ncbi:MAG TPA: PQQ-binding-like beta-propeller repeat protein [Prolixibacteraceae bacterium]|nr:PQQ-binding-like beta-propeller repeat protein [Prolixibacteraceae bacterium]
MKHLFALTILFLILLSSAWSQGQTAWRGGTNGVYTAEGLLPSWPESGPEIAWVFEGLGEGHSSPVLALGHIFVSTMIGADGYIVLLTRDGKEVKRYVYGPEYTESYPGSRSTPVISGGWLYIYSGLGVIYAFDAMEGKLRWSRDMLKETDGKNIQWGVTETLALDGDVLYCSPGGKKENVVALNRLNGQTIWTSAGVGDLSAYCTPLVVQHGSRKLLVTMMASHIQGIDAKSGEFLWSYEQPNQWSVHANTPIYTDNALICTSGYGQGTVRLNVSPDGSSVEKAWFNSLFDNRIGGVVYLDGYLYASGDKNRGWRCLDAKTGEEKWYSNELANGVVIAADGLLFLYTERGELALAKASPDGLILTGKTKVEYGTAQHWAHPVIDQGILYLHHGKALIAYKIK